MEKYRKLIDQALEEHDKLYEDTTLGNKEKIKKFGELLSSTYPKIPQGEDSNYIRGLFEGVMCCGNKKTLGQADRLYQLHYQLGYLAHIIQDIFTNILSFAQGINVCKFENLDNYFEKAMPENYYKIYKSAIGKNKEVNNDNATIEP